MPYHVVYSSELAHDKREMQLLDKASHRRVIAKLEEDPTRFRPLQRELKGYWRIREGDVRVVYQVRQPDLVMIVAIDRRRDDEVYSRAARRAI